MSRKFLFVAGAWLAALMLFAFGDILDRTPKAAADPYSISFDMTLTDSGAGAGGDGDGIIEVGEQPVTVAVFQRDIVGAPADEPYFSKANTIWTGITQAKGSTITDGDTVGAIDFSINSNLATPLTDNISPVTGQPPRCGAGVVLGTGGTPFKIYDSELDTTQTVSEQDVAPQDGTNDTQQDILLADCSTAGSNGLADGIDCMPSALATYTIPSLGLGTPASRSFGIAPVYLVLGVQTDVNFLTYDLTANPYVGGYLSVILIGYPGVPSQPATAGNIPDKTVLTCPPFSTAVTIYGVTQGNADATPPIAGGTNARTVSAAGTFRYDVLASSNDNYDGDTAADNRDTCHQVVSTGVDVGVAEADNDNWDGSCDPYPNSDDNDSDGTVGPYLLPSIGTFPSSPGGCPVRPTGNWECDQDVDGDTVLNTIDNCPFNANDTQADDDNDGVGNACDPAPTIKGDGTGYSVDAHPHGFGPPGASQPFGYHDHDDICSDPFTIGAAEGTGDGSCLTVGANGILGDGDDGTPWVDSNDDSLNPDWVDLNGNMVYNLGEPVDTRGDADNDKQSDACEAVEGSDPLDPTSGPAAPSLNFDCDGDTGPDSWEEAAYNKGAPGPGLNFDVADASFPDTDGDGCTDVEESQTNGAKGGNRNWNNPRDFYDITNISGVLGARDLGVSGFDLGMLLGWIGASAGSSPYDDDSNSNTIADGLELDFASIAGPATGPDGGISGFDLGQMLSELGASCAGPPY